MSKNSNKLQLSNDLKNRYYVAKCKGYCSQSPDSNVLKHNVSNNIVNNATLSDTIAKECNKPLQSASWVSAYGKQRKEWNYNQDKHYGVYRAVGNLWLCRDRKIQSLSDCEREQIKLYNRLKREYEREQKLLREGVQKVDDAIVTQAEKLQATVRKRSIQLLNGLTCSPNYDRIYGVG